MAVRIGGVEFQVRANVAQASKAFTTLGRTAARLEQQIKTSRELFGGLGKQLTALRTKTKTSGEGFKGLGKDLGDFSKKAKTTKDSLKKVDDELKDKQKDVRRTSDEFRAGAAAVGSFAAALGGIKLLAFAKDATLLAARVENLGTVLDNVGRISGLNAAQIRNIEESTKALGITTRAARQSLSQLAQANLDLRKAVDLTRIAQDAAVIAGVDSSEAFNRLVISIQRNDVRLLRNLGIVINLNSVYRKFAQETGRTAASLTAFEKRQLLLNEVIERGRLIQGTYEASLRDVFKQLTSLRRIIEEAVLVFGKQFVPVLEVVVKRTTDFLVAFQKGQTAIGPRFVALVTIAVGVITTMAAAFGAVAAAIALVTAAGGPLTLIFLGLTAAITAGVVAWADYKLEIAAAEQRLKDVEEQAENTAQAIEDNAEPLRRIQELAKKPEGLLNADDLRTIRKEATRLAKAFPELGKSIEDAAARGRKGAREIVGIFEKRLPEALLTTEERLESFGERREAAEKRFRSALLTTFRVQEGVFKRQQILERETRAIIVGTRGRLSAIQAREIAERRIAVVVLERERKARRRFAEALANGVDEYIRLNPLLVKNTEALRTNGDEILRVNAAIAQTLEAQVTRRIQAFQQEISQLVQGANRAGQIVQKLENERLRLAKGTGIKILQTFIRNQEQIGEVRRIADKRLIEEAAREEKDLLKQNKAASEARLRDLRIQLTKQDITQKEFREAQIKETRRFNAENAKVIAAAEQKIAVVRRANLLVTKAQTLASEAFTEAVRQEEEALRSRNEEARLLAEGISPQIIRARKRFQDETVKLTAAIEQTEKQLRSLVRVSELGIVFFDPKQIKQAEATLKFLDILRKKQIAAERRANEEIARIRKKRDDRRLKELEEINRKILRLSKSGREQLRRSTVEGIESEIKAFERGGQRVRDFVSDLQFKLGGPGQKAIKKVSDEFKRFRKNLRLATDEAQLANLQKLFPQVIADRIKGAAAGLRKAKEELKEFQEIGKAEQQQRDRVRLEERFNELVKAGATQTQIKFELDKLRTRQAAKIKAQEDELKAGVEDTKKAQEALLGTQKKLQRQITALVARRKREIAEINALRVRRLELLKKETAELKEQARVIENARAAEAKAVRGGVTGRGRTPGAGLERRRPAVLPTPTPPAPEGRRAEAALLFGGKGRTKEEITELKESIKQNNATREETISLIQGIIANIRGDTESAKAQRTRWLQILREAEAGKRAFGSIGGGRR